MEEGDTHSVPACRAEIVVTSNPPSQLVSRRQDNSTKHNSTNVPDTETTKPSENSKAAEDQQKLKPNPIN